MLKRMKIVTSLLLVLALFGLLQLASGGLFFNSLKNDKENFTVLQTIRQQQSALNATWVELLQTRNTLNRAGIRYMMDQSNIGSGASVSRQAALILDARRFQKAPRQHSFNRKIDVLRHIAGHFVNPHRIQFGTDHGHDGTIAVQ